MAVADTTSVRVTLTVEVDKTDGESFTYSETTTASGLSHDIEVFLQHEFGVRVDTLEDNIVLAIEGRNNL